MSTDEIKTSDQNLERNFKQLTMIQLTVTFFPPLTLTKCFELLKPNRQTHSILLIIAVKSKPLICWMSTFLELRKTAMRIVLTCKRSTPSFSSINAFAKVRDVWFWLNSKDICSLYTVYGQS